MIALIFGQIKLFFLLMKKENLKPLPEFRLIGRYADASGAVAFFVHGQQVIVARRGTRLPGNFVLKTIRKDTVVLQRKDSQETTELRLGPP